jgi:hypothetical protein
MPRGTLLDTAERAVRLQLHGLGLLQKVIVMSTAGTPKVISSILKDPASYGGRSDAVKYRKIDNRGIRVLVREAKKGVKGWNEVVGSINLGVSRSYTYRLLSSMGRLELTKLKRKLYLPYAMNVLLYKQKRPKLSTMERNDLTSVQDNQDSVHHFKMREECLVPFGHGVEEGVPAS